MRGRLLANRDGLLFQEPGGKLATNWLKYKNQHLQYLFMFL
ncbi:MAG: hypothetical protein ACFFD4_26775 [Candidatus Odinarchaeota archaeon]